MTTLRDVAWLTRCVIAIAVASGTTLNSLVEVESGVQEGQEIVVEMRSGEQLMGAPQRGQQASSPFMPRPPKKKK